MFLFSFWDLLPEEIMNEIFGYLDFISLSRILLVSRRWKEIGLANNLWKVQAQILFGKIEQSQNYRKFIIDNTSTELNPTTPILWRNPAWWGDVKNKDFTFSAVYPKDYQTYLHTLKTFWVTNKSIHNEYYGY